MTNDMKMFNVDSMKVKWSYSSKKAHVIYDTPTWLLLDVEKL